MGKTAADRNEIVRQILRPLARRSPHAIAHAERVAVYAVSAGYALGLSDGALVRLRYAAALHDIGQLAWPDDLWASPTAEARGAWECGHPDAATPYLQPHRFLAEPAAWIRGRRETWAGDGFPDGLLGEAIPLPARILAAAEAMDLALHGGPEAADGRPAWDAARFDPQVVAALRKYEAVIQPMGA